jgi:hypothetical protein
MTTKKSYDKKLDQRGKTISICKQSFIIVTRLLFQLIIHFASQQTEPVLELEFSVAVRIVP